ncbi:MAG: RluA family pseudouridine synthase [Bdellovibrionales bacterium]
MLKTQNVTSDESGIRLDRWFRRHFPGVSHGQLQKLLRTGQVRVDGKRAEANTRLEEGQNIRVPPQATNAPPKEALAKRSARVTQELKKLILFEDDDVIAINKPPGLAVQGGTGLKENLDDMLGNLAGQGKSKPKLVHRLDRDTTGVLLLARNALAATRLTEAFRQRTTQKIYWAVTAGVPKPAKGKITAPLIKHGEIMKVAEDEAEEEEAKSATTIYQIVESAKKLAAFVALWPVTGRTHQLRVHMTYVGTPIIGDRLYGDEKATALPVDEIGKGLHLHARRLVLPHPRRGTLDVVAPLPPEMRKTWGWFGFDPQADPDFSDA